MEVTYEVDTIWRNLGTWGKYQVFQLVLIVVDMIPCVLTILGAVYTGYIPDYECKRVPEDVNITGTNLTEWDSYEYRKCEYDVTHHYGNNETSMETMHCTNGYTYAQDNSYSSQWDLVCKRSNLAALAQSLVLAGQGIGALVMSHLADRFGRKTVHVISHIGTFCTSLTMAFSTNIYMIAVLRLVAGTFQQGMVCTGKVLSLELFPREVRGPMEAITFLAWTGGIMVLTLYGYAFQWLNWRYLQIGLTAFSIYSFIEWWLMDESIRWLLVNGKKEEAVRVLKKAARWNNVNFSDVEKLLQQNTSLLAPVSEDSDGREDEKQDGALVIDSSESSADTPTKVQKSSKKYTVLDIMKNPALRTNTFILWYAWIVATGTYYGLLLVSSHLAGDRFLNFFLSGVIEAPALLMELYLFNKIGRKKTMILWYAITGVSLITSTALLTTLAHIRAVSVLATVLSLCGKMAITGSFSTVFLYTPEIYPTNYRNSGLGIASSISRIGGILAPFVSNLALIALWIPGAIFGGMCLLVTVLAFRLPESMKHELPQTLKECDEWEVSSSDSSTSGTNDKELIELKR